MTNQREFEISPGGCRAHAMRRNPATGGLFGGQTACQVLVPLLSCPAGRNTGVVLGGGGSLADREASRGRPTARKASAIRTEGSFGDGAPRNPHWERLARSGRARCRGGDLDPIWEPSRRGRGGARDPGERAGRRCRDGGEDEGGRRDGTARRAAPAGADASDPFPRGCGAPPHGGDALSRPRALSRAPSELEEPRPLR